MDVDNLIITDGELELIKRKVAVITAVDGLMLQDARVDVMRLLAEDLAISVKAFVLSHDLVDSCINVAFDSPATWIQHLRKRLGWNYRIKVEREQVHLKEWLHFPKATIATKAYKTSIRGLGGEAYVGQSWGLV